MGRPRIAVLPEDRAPALSDAVEEGGGELVDVADAEALMWVDAAGADRLREVLDEHPDIGWVQLPWAGIEPFVDVLDDRRTWTCGKGVYAEPVAEHVLALALGGMRGVGRYARATTWSEPYGVNLLGGRVTILGGGAITTSLVRLLRPFGAHLTVVRRRPDPIPGVAEVVGMDRLHEALAGRDLVVLALALTPETRGVIDAAALDAMAGHAWLVNVARGGHVVTDDLVAALREGRIGGAALDVTDPEPLPDDHPLWTLDNVIITPHVGNTPEMGRKLLANRIRENVQRYGDGQELLGPVFVDLGY
ncbi:D-isomer specific 2-hydroxyacid dehydrogenase family protein [Egicoccus sp. AB-alg2]|uniref:D-isomer specific 2-hydroxyacid dehydrogenase family protein n=1 Tax=Egicoccus sp. AB-alg2 TaxID=3242693 RepID=UPI00359E84FB